MHSSVLQNDDYIKFSDANTVEVISLSRLDEGISKNDPKAAEFDAKDDDGKPVKRMLSYPNLTKDEMLSLNRSKAGTYNNTGKIPFTCIVNPHDEAEMQRFQGGQSAKSIMEAVATQRKVLNEKFGPSLSRPVIREFRADAKKVLDAMPKSGVARAASARYPAAGRRGGGPEGGTMSGGFRRAAGVLAVCGVLASCDRGPKPGERDDFAPHEREFASPDDGRVHVRALKQRDGAPPARDGDRLAEAFLPGIGGAWRIGHEFAAPVATRCRFEIGDRIDLRDDPAFPSAGDASAPPVVLLRFSVLARPGEPFVVLVGHGGFGAASVRAVVAGPTDGVVHEGASHQETRAADPATGLPDAVLLDAGVPPASRPPAAGAFPGFAMGQFGANGLWLQLVHPTPGWMHLGSWVAVPLEGGSRSSVTNDVRTFATGDFEARCDGLELTVLKGGEPCDWTTYPHAFWTVRMRAEPVGR